MDYSGNIEKIIVEFEYMRYGQCTSVRRDAKMFDVQYKDDNSLKILQYLILTGCK